MKSLRIISIYPTSSSTRHLTNKAPLKARIPALTVSSSKFRWLDQGAWDDLFFQYFAANRPQVPLLIFRAPPFEAARRKGKSAIGRWILSTMPNHEILGWAEVQLRVGNFTNVQLTIGGSRGRHLLSAESGNPATELVLDALSLLVSGLLIALSPDTISVAFSDEQDRTCFRSLIGPEWGTRQQCLTTRPFGWRFQSGPALVPVEVIQTSPQAWQQSPMWARDSKELAWLTKRMTAMVPPPRVRASFIERFTKGLSSILNPGKK